MDRAANVVDKILRDLTDRRGLSNEWDAIDEDIQDEIKDKWRTLVTEEFQAAADEAQKADEFWKMILQAVIDEEGVTAAEAVRRELHDFHYMMEQYPIVLCHATGGLLSKVMYESGGVCEAIDNHTSRLAEEAIDDAKEEWEAQNKKVSKDDLLRYAVTVFRPMFDRARKTSLGQDIAYAVMCAALNDPVAAPLSDYQKELLEQHTRDGRITP